MAFAAPLTNRITTMAVYKSWTVLIVTILTERCFLFDQQLFLNGAMGCMAGFTALFNRGMNVPTRKILLLMTVETNLIA